MRADWWCDLQNVLQLGTVHYSVLPLNMIRLWSIASISDLRSSSIIFNDNIYQLTPTHRLGHNCSSYTERLPTVSGIWSRAHHVTALVPMTYSRKEAFHFSLLVDDRIINTSVRHYFARLRLYSVHNSPDFSGDFVFHITSPECILTWKICPEALRGLKTAIRPARLGFITDWTREIVRE